MADDISVEVSVKESVKETGTEDGKVRDREIDEDIASKEEEREQLFGNTGVYSISIQH